MYVHTWASTVVSEDLHCSWWWDMPSYVPENTARRLISIALDIIGAEWFWPVARLQQQGKDTGYTCPQGVADNCDGVLAAVLQRTREWWLERLQHTTLFLARADLKSHPKVGTYCAKGTRLAKYTLMVAKILVPEPQLERCCSCKAIPT